jgi:Protein of unknown function (DUF3987)
MSDIIANFQPVTKQNPCIHCGKPDWCYRIGKLSVCNRDLEPAPGWKKTSKKDDDGHYFYAPSEEKSQKSIRPAHSRTWAYPNRDGNPFVRVIRIDNGKGGKPTRWQEHWDGSSWVKGLKSVNRADIPIYRYAEVRAAFLSGKTIYIVEGEPCADALWSLGLPATTNIGGSGKWKSSDSRDLCGANVVLCPDRDKPGVAHMKTIQKDFPDARWLYAFPDSPFWNNLPNSGGLDVVDWINDYGVAASQIENAVEETRPVDLLNNSSQSVVSNSNLTPQSALDIFAMIDELIELDLSRSLLTAELNKLASLAAIPISEVRKLYQERQKEIEQLENRETIAASLEQLLDSNQASIDLSTVLPTSLANPIKKLARWLNLRPECYLTALLTGISALHDTKTKLILNHDWDFEVAPNLFGAIVAPSSQKKSPIIKAMVTKPLRLLQKKAIEKYTEARNQYQLDLNRYEELKRSKNTNALDAAFPDGKPQEPRQKLYYFTHGTGEGIIQQIAAHPDRGMLYLKDELAGVFKGANQYRGGRGSDEEDLLSYYDGTGGTVLRASGITADLDGLLLGVLGSIQPGVLQKLLGNCEDANGNWARFMFVNQPLTASQMKADGGSFDLTGLIEGLYEEIDRTNEIAPTQYRLSRDAFELFCSAYNHLEKQRIDITTNSAMQNAWGKSPGRIGKLAINLHRIKAAMAKEIPSSIIDRDTIEAAISLTYFYARQVQALYMTLEDEQALPPMLAKVIEVAIRKGTWVRTRDVQFAFSTKKRPSPETIRQWFKELVELGQGITNGRGRSLSFLYQPK